MSRFFVVKQKVMFLLPDDFLLNDKKVKKSY